jgi:hypothetical protein
MADPRNLAKALQHSTAGGAQPHTPAQVIAAALAEHGRKGDTVLAHLNQHEVKLLNKLTDGATVNPKTGLLEFSEDDGGGDSGGGDSGGSDGDSGGDSSSSDDSSSSSDGYGGSEGTGGHDSAGGYGDAPSDFGGWGEPSDAAGLGAGYDSYDFTADNPGGADALAAQNLQNFNPYADPFGNAGLPNDPYKQTTTYDSANKDGKPGLGDWLGDKVSNAVNNPATTLANMLIGQIPVIGQLNTLSGLAGGPTIGGGITQAARDATNYGGGVQVAASQPQTGVSAGQPGSDTDQTASPESGGSDGGGAAPRVAGAGGNVPFMRMRGVQNIPLVQGLQMWRAPGQMMNG